MNNPLLKFVMRTKKDEALHSSVFGRSQNRSGVGATSTSSFSERMKIEQNRKRVKGYNDSRIVSQAAYSSGIKAKTYTPPARETGDNINRVKPLPRTENKK